MSVEVEHLDSFAGREKEDDGFGDKELRGIVPRYIPSPVKAYTSNNGTGNANSLAWENAEWDLAECGRILDVESFVRRAFRNKKNLFLKEGYEFVGAKPERTRYIKRRIKQMEIATKTPFAVLMSQTVWSLVRCSNAFWVKKRDAKASGGRIRDDISGKKLNPVAGYFIMAPETVRFKRDENGQLKKYEQHVNGKVAKEFNPEDVIHFYFDKREGFSVGTPILTSVKDDIRALRRIEANIELLIQQHLFPLFHYTVGTKDSPAKIYPDGTDEVQEVRLNIASMPADGCWVTPENHSIEAIGSKGAPVAVEKIIEYLKNRIFTGLGNSSVDMGEGGSASRSTAQTMSRNLVDDTKADQLEFASQFKAHVITELMLESSFSDAEMLDEENEVYLRFKEIDIEARQAKENHLVDIFLKNAITHDEMRVQMGYEPFQGNGWPTANSKSVMLKQIEGEFSRTNYGLIERDKIVLQSIDEPGTPESRAASSSAGGSSVSNKNTPSNQHGTRSSAKTNKDGISHVPSLSYLYSISRPMRDAYDTLRKDISNSPKITTREAKLLVDLAFTQAKERLISHAQTAYRHGVQDVNADMFKINLNAVDGKILDHVSKYVNKMHDDLVFHINRNPIIAIELVFNALDHRTSLIDNGEIMRAYNYGRIMGYQQIGFDKLVPKCASEKSCAKCSKSILSYNQMDAIIYEDIPPLHPGCECVMENIS